VAISAAVRSVAVRVALFGVLGGMLAGCGPGAPGASAASPVVVAPPSLGPAINVAGSAKTGASSALALEGSYAIKWSAAADKPGCIIHLVVTSALNGPPVVDLGQGVQAGKAPVTGSASFSVASGRYYIQADRSAPLACKGAWTATLNAQIAGAS
jgi:hypothetical protein